MSEATSETSSESRAETRETTVSGKSETHLRSLVKAFSWRVFGTLSTAAIAYLVTGQLDTAALIGGIEFVLKFIIYYLHERFWALVPIR